MNCVILFPILLLIFTTRGEEAINPTSYQCGLTTAGWTVPAPPQDVSLKHVIAIIRHGDRTPYNGSKCWSTDDSVWNCDLVHGQIPVDMKLKESDRDNRIFDKVFMSTNEPLRGNCSVGQLTSIGYEQHIANGRSLNAAYIKTGFLKPSLDPSEVYIRSDDFPRTILSAQTLIQGMFPPEERGSGNIQHVPLYTRDLMYDNMEANGILCPKYYLYKDQFLTSKQWLDHKNTTDYIINSISKAVGYDIGTDLSRFCDCLTTHYCHNFSWPAGMTEELSQLAKKEFTWQGYNILKYPSVQESSQVGIGFLLKDIWKNLNDSLYFSDEEQHEKFHLYSGHDTTLMQLLVALQLDEEEIWPPYSSMMLIELYLTSPARSVGVLRLMYNGKVKMLPFCNGQELCDYNTFSQYLQTVTPSDNYQTNCQV